MNYYIQGDAAKADQIKAAFEKLGYDTSGHLFNAKSVLYFTLDGEIRATTCNCTPAIIKTHPDYKELELPVEPKFKKGETIKSDSGSWVIKEVDVENQCYVVNDGWIEFKLQDQFKLEELQPKFKVGDWIVRTDGSSDVPILVYGLKQDRYLVTNMLGMKGEVMLTHQDKWRLWTIEDAKDGDVITNGKLIVIFNKLEEPAYKQHIIAHVGLDLCGRLQITEDTWQLGVDKAMPANKEQCNLLFKIIKEVGYEWDEKKKELRKIKPHYDISNFNAGMPVLVRDNNGEEWRHTAFSHMTSRFYENKFAAGCTYWCQCIPYNDDTKHLLGTTDMCDEMYINW